MVSRVSTERMRIRKIRINPLATRDLAEKHVLKLVEGFFGQCRGVFKKVQADDGLSGALCDTCHKRLELIWKKKKSSFAILAKDLLKRRHPLYPLTPRQDAETACHSDMEKGYSIPFENVPIKPIPIDVLSWRVKKSP